MARTRKELPVLLNSGEATSVSRTDDTRPKRSPYASPICYLYFQNGVLKIHEDFLSPKLASRCSPSFLGGTRLKNLYFDDISIDAGHVIANFLTTGSYSCFQAQGESIGEKELFELATALQVCTAAGSLELPSLRALATNEFKRLADGLDVLSILRLTHDLKSAPEEVTLFMMSRVKEFCEGLTDASAATFLSEVGTPKRVSELLFKCMVELKIQRPLSGAELGTNELSKEERTDARKVREPGETTAGLHFDKICETRGQINSFTEQSTFNQPKKSFIVRQQDQQVTPGDTKKAHAAGSNQHLHSWPIHKESAIRDCTENPPKVVTTSYPSYDEVAKSANFWQLRPSPDDIKPTKLLKIQPPEAVMPPESTDRITDNESTWSDRSEDFFNEGRCKRCEKCYSMY